MMRGLLRGQSVEVIRVIVSYVDGVLVGPGATADSAANARPDADRVAYTLAFPKGYDKPLRDCRIIIHGREYRVVGDRGGGAGRWLGRKCASTAPVPAPSS